ncbi:hypothetical protein ASPVEDRAFT_238650 [Aspergillus versicolor CBS 583.65]|uniref:Uncharacterized protein n=1 Tax=Aspergillus versicolor CBS 583.65 TaxID=1036611 RepID=A0A1L9P4Q4_ASPVE|nr:uncharacterized protein ASPVEDRAFT_238650 [Aspergillus versicolor CBS 583.65]OJI96476.1 hypothetical protein ASPVEDRAFT_238650 [Aspergillus versicolor CBS 583.65]
MVGDHMRIPAVVCFFYFIYSIYPFMVCGVIGVDCWELGGAISPTACTIRIEVQGKEIGRGNHRSSMLRANQP